jgi:hypothetical protein
MNHVRKVVSALGGIFLAALLIAALAPKVTHAVVATLVQVNNTSANPVPTVVVDAVNSFDANGFCQFLPSDNGVNDFCLVDPIYTVPAGQIAIVEHASGRCVVDAGTAVREARFRIGPGGALDATPTQYSFFVPGQPEKFLDFGSIVSFAQATKTYVKAGSAIDLEVFASASQSSIYFNDSCEVDISGYLVNP